MKNLDQARYHTFRADLRVNALSALVGRSNFSDKEADKYLSDIRQHLERALLHIEELEALRIMESLDEDSE